MKTSDNYYKNIRWPEFGKNKQQDRIRIEYVLQKVIDVKGHDERATRTKAAGWHALTILRHQDIGSQVWVSRQVSDDLIASTMDAPTFEELVWPSKSLEFYFEDPDLCSMLLVLNTGAAVAQWACEKLENPMPPGMLDGHDKPFIEVIAQHKSESGFYAAATDIRPDELQAMCDMDYNPRPETDQPDDQHTEVDACDVQKLKFMLLLALKVLILAAIPKFTPRPTLEQPSKREGGKAGFMNRNKLPRYVVKYLPEHLAERQAHINKTIREGGHTFRGRNGHMRTYRADRYKAAKGLTQFIFPVPGPDGTVPRRKFKVV